MKSPTIIALASFLATAAIIKAAPALAEPVTPQNVSIVHTADLDLSTKAGQRRLDHRLVIAAGEVCGTASDVDLVGGNAVRRCRTDVLARARARSEQIASRRAGTILVATAR
jgi:UrcA family protein